ncbi:unnamed protein product, partial [Strongylus vulgaris]
NSISQTKRLGGAFGGKTSQSIPPAICAVIAANTLKKPVSVVLSRYEDMLITGKRHPSMIKYKVGTDTAGFLKCAHVQFYLDGGCSQDLSGMVTWLATTSFDGCFQVPVLRAEGYTLKTNKTSNTAFRGFGVPQAYFAMNSILEHVAHAVGKRSEEASALVQIYLDGTVAVSIGGVEMGQGLNTKCLQVASRALSLPIDMITIIDSGTDKTCNAPETGGSQNSDIHGKAVKKYGIPEDSPTYHTSGVACVLSEIDCRTGEHKLLSVDIVLDVGRSLNPAVDIGQIEGAFMQGYGLMTCEELTYDDDGKLIQDSLYKFRVKLLKDSNVFAEQVYSSKGIGEPPLMLGVSTIASLRYAINARRQDLGLNDFIEISAPLTAAKIISFCNP